MASSSLSNQNVLDFYKLNGKRKCIEYVQENNSVTILPSSKSYEYSLSKLLKEVEKYEKGKSRVGAKENYDFFLSTAFQMPRASVEKRIPHTTNDEQLNIQDALLNEKIKTTSVMKKLVLTENKNIENTQQLEKTNNTLKVTNNKLQEYKLKLKRTSARENYALQKVQKLENIAENIVERNCCLEKDASINQLERQLRQKDTEIEQLKEQLRDKIKEIGELTGTCEYLNDVINEQDNNIINENVNVQKQLTVFDDVNRRYSQAFKQCVYELLQHNVSASKVSNVVKAVLKLVNTIPNKLPSKSTILEMNLQRLYLSQTQLCEVFARKENTTLMTDETSKFGNKFMGYEAADSDGHLWVLGLRDIETKSSTSTLKVFREILNDLDEKSSDDNETSRSIICHITATMSDRAATEVKFNDLLSSYRKEILPLTYYNYATFTEEEKSVLENLSNFFCGLHALVNFADAAQKCLKEVENGIFEGSSPTSDTTFKNETEPGSCRLVRTAAKAFGEGSNGDEKSGCQGNFKAFVRDFLRQNGLKSVPLRSYRGSRFNVLFANASAMFFLHEQMISFLESCGAENKLLKSILFDLKVKEYLAGVKTLGLISTFITCPLWCILEDKSISIVDMNMKYYELVTYMEEAAENVAQFMSGQILVFGDKLKKDRLYDSLLIPRDYDQTVQSFLEVILPAFVQLGRKLYKDHLPGGKLRNVTPEREENLKGVPKTSCFAESVFGQLDHLMRTKPNLKTLAAESCIMFANNKTLDWLQSKHEKERNELMKKASKGVKELRTKFKMRLHEIEENRRIALNEKIIKKQNTEREKIRKQEVNTNEIIRHGLWQSEMEVENMLRSYEKESEKVCALKCQLRFRKEVLLQVPENKSSFNFSKSVEGKKSRKSLNATELAENLKILIRQAVVKDAESNEEKHILVGKRVKHRFMEEGVEKWYHGKIVSQVNAKSSSKPNN